MVVYLDMDGVIVDFVTGVAKYMNQPEKGAYEADPPTTWELGRHFGVSNNELHRRLDGWGEAFWRKLTPTPVFELLVHELGREKVVILTALTNSPSCAAGKMAWLSHWFKCPAILTTAPKALLAGPDTLLIDDKEENVTEFRGAGGRAIVWPAPWNSQRADFPGCKDALRTLNVELGRTDDTADPRTAGTDRVVRKRSPMG